MNWKQWYDWKERRLIAVVLFVVAYTLTIPIRDYGFLDSFFDTSQGVAIWIHLILIVAGVIILLIGLKMLEVIVKKFVLRR